MKIARRVHLPTPSQERVTLTIDLDMELSIAASDGRDTIITGLLQFALTLSAMCSTMCSTCSPPAHRSGCRLQKSFAGDTYAFLGCQ